MADSYAVNGNVGFDADCVGSSKNKNYEMGKVFCAEYEKDSTQNSIKQRIIGSGILMFGRKKRRISQRYLRSVDILSSLNGKWDLGQSFEISGRGASSVLAKGLNLVFRRLESFVSDLTRNSAELGTMAPGMLSISRKVLESAENLCVRSEEMETSCRSISEEMRETADRSVSSLEKSASIVSEISRARDLTKDSLDSMAMIDRNMEKLSGVISDLDKNSKSIGDIIGTISDISDRTGLLSLNAFIEAARAGESGAGFGVIAKEIRQLSDQSGKAACEIKEALTTIGSMIEATVSSVIKVRECVSSGLSVSMEADCALNGVAGEHSGFHGQLESVLSSVRDQEKSVSRLLSGISGIAESGRSGVLESRELAGFADRIRSLSDKQLESSGTFILPQYRRVESEIVQIAEESEVKDFGQNLDGVMAEKIALLPYVELIYLTDSRGTQVSANIFSDPNMSEEGLKARGKDWSEREWFRNVKAAKKNYISDIYRSRATDSYCMTISVPVIKDGEFKGVLGADINFENLMNI